MYYSDDMLKEMKAGYQTIDGKLNYLVEKYFLLGLKNPRAREFATQGYPRRLKIMVRCMDNVFGTIPPDREDLPSRDELSDATISIQSFVFNVFGSIDNLAWIWMHEKGQKRTDGTPIPDGHIGLGPKNTSVAANSSLMLNAYFQGFVNADRWDEATIVARAESLFPLALKTWPSP